MDKKEKAIIGIGVAAVAGILAYEYLSHEKTTTTTYTVTLVNNCDEAITVNYTNSSGVKQSVTLQPGQKQTITVLAGSKIIYAVNSTIQEIPISSNQTINLCLKSTSNAYAVQLINQCSQPITVNYINPQGQQSSVTVPANSANTQIQVQPGSTLTWQAYGKQMSVTINLPDQRIMVCQGAWTITIINQYSSAVTIGYIDQNQNYKTITLQAGQQQTLTIAANSALNIGGTSFAVCGNNAYVTIYSLTNVVCSFLPPGQTSSSYYEVTLINTCYCNPYCPLVGVTWTAPNGVPQFMYLMNSPSPSLPPSKQTIKVLPNTTVTIQIIQTPSLQQTIKQYTITRNMTINTCG